MGGQVRVTHLKEADKAQPTPCLEARKTMVSVAKEGLGRGDGYLSEATPEWVSKGITNQQETKRVLESKAHAFIILLFSAPNQGVTNAG